MRSLLTIFILFLTTHLNAQFCTYDGRFTNIPFFTDTQISAQVNITYANAVNWNGGNQQLLLDAYYPDLAIDTMPLRPLILMVHGGSLIYGNKHHYSGVCREFAKRGFVAISINYRLGLDCTTDTISEEKAKYRAQQDVNAAFRFIALNASLLRVDTSWMFIGGGSAGSIVSLATVYMSQDEWNVFTPGIQLLLGDLNNSGNNLTNTFSIKGIFNDWGAMISSCIKPTEMIPMISFHGDADNVFAIDSFYSGGCLHLDTSYGSRAMHNLLVSNGVCSDLCVEPGGAHGVFMDTICGIPFRVGRAAGFFKNLFCNNCSSTHQAGSINSSCSFTTGILTNSVNNEIAVYPNPFYNKINISLTGSNQNYLLTNQMGQVIYAGQSIQTNDFSNLPTGMYFLKTENSKLVKTFKLVKE